MSTSVGNERLRSEKGEEKARMAEMSEDLVFQILCLLPVVSLLRFKSVCKSWRSLIESSEFITGHLHTCKQGQGSLVFDLGSVLVQPCFALLSGENLDVYKHLDFPEPIAEVGDPRIISSCNGIICMHHRLCTTHMFCPTLSLWNPATKHYRLLPECPSPFPEELFPHVHYGFGFVTKTNDYELVRIVFEDYRVAWDDFKESNINNQVMVYSLNTNSWTHIQTVLPANTNTIVSDLYVPLGDGVCCWFGKYEYFENELLMEHCFILTFDFTTHIFGTMPLPNVYSYNNIVNTNLILSLLCGKLACIHWQFDFSERGDWHCKIWVLNESGVNDSWAHLYTITLDESGAWAFPIALSMDGKLIWKKKGDVPRENRLCLCDPVTQELRVLPFERPISHDLQAPIYKESLVSLETANGASHRVNETVSHYSFSKFSRN